MMDFDEALEHVLEGCVVARTSWGTDDIVRRHFEVHGDAVIPIWKTTRLLSLPDWTAEDWQVVGTLQ